ncbi:ATP-binding cassette transporter snq2 [Neofusicoccum ribis]|uniref:ATP-binding cassette transporter snq2 n=1 Tax=Neofusicoccum ribis TaxID=45134 RepID=A0ABR3SJE7_9PEZI
MTPGSSAHKTQVKGLGVSWEDLTVKVRGAATQHVRTFPDAVVGSFGPDLYRLVSSWFQSSPSADARTILHGFSGSIRSGEMLLVLGRPGSGCTTFLRAIANHRHHFLDVSGDVSYGCISAREQAEHYRGEITYCPEDDVHFPRLRVWDTLLFALQCRAGKQNASTTSDTAHGLLETLRLEGVKETRVGDAFVRGVSGGERKRVSIAEILAADSALTCWDNSTRGLDSTTALEYAKTLRNVTDSGNRSTAVTLYQAGEGIYALMDKVLLIDDGRCVFFGPAAEAKRYFIGLGFECPPRMTTADFLVSVTDPIARRIRAGYEDRVPRTAESLEAAYKSSPHHAATLQGIQTYRAELQDNQCAETEDFKRFVAEAKGSLVRNGSVYASSFPQQVFACARREVWLLVDEPMISATKCWNILVNALVVGSLFYGQGLDTSGAFSRGGSLFFSALFICWVQLPELNIALAGRPIVQRQHGYAFYRPAALALAKALVDGLVLAVASVLLCVIFYFMANLDAEPGKFFVYLLFVFMVSYSMTELYRMFGSVSPTLDTAIRFSATAQNLLIIFAGYIVPRADMSGSAPWFAWLYWINPMAYGFEAVFSNDFRGRTMTCSGDLVVPRGPDAVSGFQSCAIGGSDSNSLKVSGERYLDAAYQYRPRNIWRNFGVLVALTILYVLLTALFSEIIEFPDARAGGLVFKRKSRRRLQARPRDEEAALPAKDVEKDQIHTRVSDSADVFMWKHLGITVPYGSGGEKHLLRDVCGYAKPGSLVALMGASGAGKTTLLSLLAQRNTPGVTSGEILANGKPVDASFRRETAFCEQFDMHDGSATVREALEFSALLRQGGGTRREKLEYVDNVIEILNLGDVQDAIISNLGLELTKRTTIAVELVARPSKVLFLDEPTTGLDSQSALSIVYFLKRLARAGQAIVCTVHQPSAELFELFDAILALSPGGRTFYFGETGPQGKTVLDYFVARGVHVPEETNIAEFILEASMKSVQAADGREGIDWATAWEDSEERAALMVQLDGFSSVQKAEVAEPAGGARSRGSEYNASTALQTWLLTKRMLVQYWRDPPYVYAKIFVATVIGIANGFIFWRAGEGSSPTDLQNVMFSCFVLIIIPAAIVNGILPKFHSNMALWEARELPSRVYGWFAFCTAQVLAEIPYATLTAVVYFLLWYYPAGLPTDASTAGYVFFMTLLYFFHITTMGQWFCAWAPSFTVISYTLPTALGIFSLFNGIIIPYEGMSVVWRYSLYWANPTTYWMGGVLAATLRDKPVRCSLADATRFALPAGETCASYAGEFVARAGGYLLSADDGALATDECAYCKYRTGDDYLRTLHVDAGDKWRDSGIFVAFCACNVLLLFFFVYT